MPLTQTEIQVAADCAEKYPRGYGRYYFSDSTVSLLPEAVNRLKDNPEAVKFG